MSKKHTHHTKAAPDENLEQTSTESATLNNQSAVNIAIGTSFDKPTEETLLNSPAMEKQTDRPGTDFKEELPLPITKHPHRHFNDFRDSPFKAHHFRPRIQSLNPKTATVLITPQAYKEMLLYVEIGHKEVGWLGTVTKLESGDFLIDKTFLLEQEVTPSETELSAEDIGKMTEALLDQGDEGFEQANRLRFWGHSHVRMGTGPSGTDENTMRHRQEEGFEWYIRGIFNKLGRAEFTIYDFELGFAVCDAPWKVIDPESGRNLTPHGGGFFGGAPRFPHHRVVEEEPFFGGFPHHRVVEEEPLIGHPLGVTGWNQRQHNLANFGHNTGLDTGTQPNRYPDQAPELVPDEALREQIKAEFAAKVSERSYGIRMGKWWNNGQNDHLVADAVQFVLGDPNNVNFPPSEIGQDAWPLTGNETGNQPKIFPQSQWPEEVVTDQGSYNPHRQEPLQPYRPNQKYSRSAKVWWPIRVIRFILGQN
jgi:hypothetical protein